MTIAGLAPPPETGIEAGPLSKDPGLLRASTLAGASVFLCHEYRNPNLGPAVLRPSPHYCSCSHRARAPMSSPNGTSSWVTSSPTCRIRRKCARTAVITQVAVFEAVNSIVGDYEPYRAPNQGAARLIAGSGNDRRGTSPCSSGCIRRRLRKSMPQREKSLAAIPEGPAKAGGIAVGIAAADAILAQRANDGFDTVVPYTPGTQTGRLRGHAARFHAGVHAGTRRGRCLCHPQWAAVPVGAAARSALEGIRA